MYQIVLSDTPFYAESGGQVGDTGVLVSEFETIEVIDTKKENNLPIHITKKLPEHPEAPMMACVDTDKRAACAANHSGYSLARRSFASRYLGESRRTEGFIGNSGLFAFRLLSLPEGDCRNRSAKWNTSVNAKNPRQYSFDRISQHAYRRRLKNWVLSPSSAKSTATKFAWFSSVLLSNSVVVHTYRQQVNIGMVKIVWLKVLLLPAYVVSKLITGARVEEHARHYTGYYSADSEGALQQRSRLESCYHVSILKRMHGLKKQVEEFMKEKEAACEGTD